jgi:hypothetical protein
MQTKTQTPSRESDQLIELKRQLAEVRAKAKLSKQKYEADFAELNEYRAVLAKLQKSVVNSDYESLMNKESALMGRISQLEAQERFEQNKTRSIQTAVR